jgi:hypothetical protein
MNFRDKLERGIILLDRYLNDKKPDFFPDLEFGAVILSGISNDLKSIDKHRKLFNKFMDKTVAFVQRELKCKKTCGSRRYSILFNVFAPGRELFPNKELHPWWWLPDQLMNEQQLKEWKEYLKSRGFSSVDNET